MSKHANLPYRKNVSIVAFSGDKFLLVNSRVHPHSWWKFPQGGIDKGEDLVSAAVREFTEELGFDGGEVVGVSSFDNYYEWPDHIVKNSKFCFRGQHQRFVLLELPLDVKLTPDSSEVEDYIWVTKKNLLRLSEDSKHSFHNYNGIIHQVIDEFSDIFKEL